MALVAFVAEVRTALELSSADLADRIAKVEAAYRSLRESLPEFRELRAK